MVGLAHIPTRARRAVPLRVLFFGFKLFLAAAIPFLEPIDSSGGINDLLLAGVKGMTLGTYFNVQVFVCSRFGG